MRPVRVATLILSVAFLSVALGGVFAATASAGLIPQAVAASGAPVAQVEPVLSSLGIDLWPNYDRAGILVIYRATIAPGVDLPASLTFRIPAAAGEPNAVAERRADGQLIMLPYERTVEGDVAVIAVTANRPALQLEYYDPAIVREGVRYSFLFRWRGDVEVGDFSVSIQQPDLAQDFVMEPAATSSGPAVDGLVYHTLSVAGVAAGETVDVSASYEKATDQLSIETMTPAAPPPPVAGEAEPAADNSTTITVLAAALVFAAAIVAALAFRSRRALAPGDATTRGTPARGAATTSGTPAQGGSPPRAPRRSPATPPASAGGTGADVDAREQKRFCTQCGAAAAAADRFCHRCGNALR